ncbi:MAG: hypothetical protein KDD50_11545 [Bdellovibrionales bacterium]|nr:hypothetical protein [Bdellovibrionales bacterium]
MKHLTLFVFLLSGISLNAWADDMPTPEPLAEVSIEDISKVVQSINEENQGTFQILGGSSADCPDSLDLELESVNADSRSHYETLRLSNPDLSDNNLFAYIPKYAQERAPNVMDQISSSLSSWIFGTKGSSDQSKVKWSIMNDYNSFTIDHNSNDDKSFSISVEKLDGAYLLLTYKESKPQSMECGYSYSPMAEDGEEAP